MRQEVQRFTHMPVMPIYDFYKLLFKSLSEIDDIYMKSSPK